MGYVGTFAAGVWEWGTGETLFPLGRGGRSGEGKRKKDFTCCATTCQVNEKNRITSLRVSRINVLH